MNVSLILFYNQACRGEKLDIGITLQREKNTEVDSSTAAYKIPKHADFLIVFSTYDGKYYEFYILLYLII